MGSLTWDGLNSQSRRRLLMLREARGRHHHMSNYWQNLPVYSDLEDEGYLSGRCPDCDPAYPMENHGGRWHADFSALRPALHEHTARPMMPVNRPLRPGRLGFMPGWLIGAFPAIKAARRGVLYLLWSQVFTRLPSNG
jgi:hypothetical protein